MGRLPSLAFFTLRQRDEDDVVVADAALGNHLFGNLPHRVLLDA
jgi:hypothetical protein